MSKKPSSILNPPSSHRWFFQNQHAVQRLRKAAAEWEHTPFRPFSRAQGRDGGIDCVGLVEELMIAARLARQGDFAFARTSADYQGHRAELRVLHYLRGKIKDDPQSAKLTKIFAELDVGRWTLDVGRFPKNEQEQEHEKEKESPMPGDIIIFRQTAMMHFGVMLDPLHFIHCLRPFGVQISNIQDPTFLTRLDALFRAVARRAPARDRDR